MVHGLHEYILSAALVVAFSSTSGVAKADCTGGSPNYYCSGVIEQLYVDASTNTAYINPAGETGDLAATCTDSDDLYVTLNVATEGGRTTYAVLLAAYLAGKSVKIRVISGTGTSSGPCRVSFVTLPG